MYLKYILKLVWHAVSSCTEAFTFQLGTETAQRFRSPVVLTVKLPAASLCKLSWLLDVLLPTSIWFYANGFYPSLGKIANNPKILQQQKRNFSDFLHNKYSCYFKCFRTKRVWGCNHNLSVSLQSTAHVKTSHREIKNNTNTIQGCKKKKGWKEGASMLDCEGAVSPKAGLVRERNYWLMFQKFHTGKMSGKLQEKKK